MKNNSSSNFKPHHNQKNYRNEIFLSEVKLFILFFFNCTGAHKHICQLLFWFEHKRRQRLLRKLIISPSKRWIGKQIHSSTKTIQRFNRSARGLIEINERFLKGRQCPNIYIIPDAFYEALRFLRNYTNWELRHMNAEDLLKVYSNRFKSLYFYTPKPKNVHNVPPIIPSYLLLYTPSIVGKSSIVHNRGSPSGQIPDQKEEIGINYTLKKASQRYFSLNEERELSLFLSKFSASEFRIRDVMDYMRWLDKKGDKIKNKVKLFISLLKRKTSSL